VSELADYGLSMRRQVHGAERIARMQELEPELTAPFELVANNAYGAVWGRTDELPLKLRSLVTVAIISAIGEEDEFRAHLRAARRAGWSHQELLEALLHTVLYAGAPRGQRAMHVALDVFSQESEDA